MSGDEASPRAKGGRPLKDPAKGKRNKYAFRMSDFTHDQLEVRASEAGRSLSEEVEYRIEQSLQKDTRLSSIINMIGGADMIMFATLVNGDLRIAIEQANAQVGGKLEWFESPDKLALVQRHMQDVVGRTAETFARMVQSGVATRTGQHMAKLAE